MLTKKAKYALKALMLMARTGHPMLIAEISEKEHIPKKFLELILLELKRDGLLESKTGRGGGYNLRARPAAVSVGRIVRLIDGPLAQIPCVSLTAYRKCDECTDETTCSIRMIMKQVRDATAEILDRTTLEDLLKTEKRSARQKVNKLLNASNIQSRRSR